jgi:acyl carrier protein
MDTLEKVKEIFRNEVDQRIDVLSFDPASSYMDQGVDSLDRSSVFLSLEEEFGIHFEDSEINELDTYYKIVSHIENSSAK